MNQTRTFMLTLGIEGAIRVHDVERPSLIGHKWGCCITVIPEMAIANLGWWAKDNEKCWDRSASECCALLVARLDALGWEVKDELQLLRAIRRICEPGPPHQPGPPYQPADQQFQATTWVEAPELDRIVYEVWANRPMSHYGNIPAPTFRKHDSPTRALNDATWHARGLLETGGKGTHVHIVSHLNSEYQR